MWIKKLVAEVNQSPRGRVKGSRATKMMKKLREVGTGERE
jgi:hypothetical protein